MPYCCMKKLIKMISSYKFSNFEFFLSLALFTLDIALVSLTNQINLDFIINELLIRFYIMAMTIIGLCICNYYWRLFYNNPERFKLTNVNAQIFVCKKTKILPKVLLCASVYTISLTIYIAPSALILICAFVSISSLPVLFNKETPGVKGD